MLLTPACDHHTKFEIYPVPSGDFINHPACKILVKSATSIGTVYSTCFKQRGPCYYRLTCTLLFAVYVEMYAISNAHAPSMQGKTKIATHHLDLIKVISMLVWVCMHAW